jgi:nicotinamidase-related amidase
MISALDRLTRIPVEDVAALRKMREGEFPVPQPLVTPALLIVDMVQAFVRDEYPTGWEASGTPCALQIAALRSAAKARDVPVIYTTTFQTDVPALIGQWGRGEAHRRVAPFSLESAAHEIVPELVPDPDDIVLVKAKPSAFYGTQLAGVLHALGTHSLIITGMTTSGCVRASVLDAFNLNYPSVVPMEAVADRSGLSHEVSLFDMGAKYADVVTSESLIAAIDDLP